MAREIFESCSLFRPLTARLLAQLVHEFQIPFAYQHCISTDSEDHDPFSSTVLRRSTDFEECNPYSSSVLLLAKEHNSLEFGGMTS